MTTRHPNITDVLYDLSDAELIESWQQAVPVAKNARYTLLAHEAELIRRMGDHLALESEKGTVVRSPQLGPYQWQRDALRKLFSDRLTESMWAEIEVPVTEVKFTTVVINKYARKLGISEAELAKCYFRAESRQELEYVSPLEERLQASLEAERAKRGMKE